MFILVALRVLGNLILSTLAISLASLRVIILPGLSLVNLEVQDVTEFIKKVCVCDLDVIHPDELITY